ncbi:hypothetical protein AB0K51_32885 [Kitasatospora sp. NPDC049285]|uniref:hypothetical protein n=1 Tax=Kitasatospora sp. NPDC049285 TaxID=3157096 RepID=UPI00343FC86E
MQPLRAGHRRAVPLAGGERERVPLVAASRRVTRVTVATPGRRVDQAVPKGTLALDSPGPAPAMVEAFTASGTRLRPLGD